MSNKNDRLAFRDRQDSKTSSSVKESSALVASSNIIISQSLYKALAIDDVAFVIERRLPFFTDQKF